MNVQKPAPPFIARFILRLHFFLINTANRILPPFIQLLFQSTGAMQSFAVHAAVRLDIAEHLRTGDKHIAELACLTNADEASLTRLMRALSFLGICRETKTGRFSLTRKGHFLCADHEISIKPLIQLMRGDTWSRSWFNLDQAVRTGESVFQRIYGEGYFDYLKSNREERALFDLWMQQGMAANAPAVVWGYPFAGFNKVVDIGGGTGYLIRAILHAHPGVREGVCFDTPEVIEHAEDDVVLGARYKRIAGDFFAEVPSGDLFILQQIMHDWDDEKCLRILGNLQKSLCDSGRLLIVEAVLRPGKQDDFYNLLDLQMLVLADGGRERTLEEFRHILDRAGFTLTRCIATSSFYSILEEEKKECDT